MSVKTYIGLGANLGDPEKNLEKALALIQEKGLGRVFAVSSFYRTEPKGVADQPWFINAAAGVETDLDPRAFHLGLKDIERSMGRPEERIKDGPRVIDLDVLVWEAKVIDSPELTVPHPRMHERRFVLEPLEQIAPDLKHPIFDKTVSVLLAGLEDPGQVKIQKRKRREP